MNSKDLKFYDDQIKRVGQSQAGTTDQLLILIQAGNKLGLYDAVDALKKAFKLQ